MAKINNIVRILDFPKGIVEYDLFSKIDKDLETGSNDCMPYKIKSIQVIDEHKILAIFEEDNSRIEARFMKDDKEMFLDELPSDRVFLSLEEVRLIDELQEITIADITYECSNVEFRIELDGTRYVLLYLN